MELNREQEIHINYQDYYIAYNKTHNIWYAHHYDEELYQDDIIIDVEALKEEPIELFDGFILDIEEFKEIENLRDTLL